MSATKSAATRPLPPGSVPRGREGVVPGAASAELDALAARAEAVFQAGVDAARRDAHAAGVPIAILDGEGCPAWLHPDGTITPADPFDPLPRR